MTKPNQTTAAQYIALHNSIARANPNVFHLSQTSVFNSLLTEKFKDRQKQFLISNSNGQPIANVVARVSPTLTDNNQTPLGMLGFFAAENQPQPVADTLAESIQWLRDQGCGSIVGPIDGDTWHSYRFNIGPFDHPPFLSEPTNPAYYPQLWKDAGFSVIESYHSKFIENVESCLSTTQPVAAKSKEKGYSMRPINMADFRSELNIIYDLSTEVFKNNFLYEPISRDDFVSLYDKARTLIHPNLVQFALDAQGKEVGFLFCIVDYGNAVESMQGQSNLFAKLKFLWNRRSAKAVNFKSIGVLPEHRRASVAALLMHGGYLESHAMGFPRANLCLIKDDNPSTKLDGGQSKILRRYELYQAEGSNIC